MQLSRLIKIGTAVFLVFAFLPALAIAEFAERSVRDAVVKIYTVYNRLNYHEPWQSLGQRLTQGSGCVISGNRILTNAHVVSDQTFIQVRRAGKAKKYTARVEVVSHESDLAILRVDDETFFHGVNPLIIGDLPKIQDRVTVIGYPDGGDTLGITEGVVSRVEHREYIHGQANLLAAQIDAPINSGNSGGPVVKDGRVVGVAFQGLNGPAYENIGYMVPTSVIRQFLKDIEDGQRDGIPELGLSMQKMENADLRHRYDLRDEHTGVLINKVYPDSPAEGKLLSGDILLSIDGQRIENDGTIEFRQGERTYLGYLWQLKQLGETMSFTVQRNKQQLEVAVPLTLPIGYERLVFAKRYDQVATYFIAGGLVFAPLTLNYLDEYGSERNWAVNAPKDLLYYYLHGEPSAERRQVVLLVKVLADELNVGYHAFVNGVITRINGRNISTIQDVVKAFSEHSGPYHEIEDTHGYRLVLDRNKTETHSDEILQRYHVPDDRSKDLQ